MTIYPSIRRFMHWTTGLMLIWLVASGVWMTELDWAVIEQATLKDELYYVHKWSGFIFLLLVLLQLFTNIVAPAPPLPAHISEAEQNTSNVVHIIMYVLMVLTPLVGWVGITGGGFVPDRLWNEWPMPVVITDLEPGVVSFLFDLHWGLAMILAALSALHILAALSHLIRSDGVFQRMWFTPTEK